MGKNLFLWAMFVLSSFLMGASNVFYPQKSGIEIEQKQENLIAKTWQNQEREQCYFDISVKKYNSQKQIVTQRIRGKMFSAQRERLSFPISSSSNIQVFFWCASWQPIKHFQYADYLNGHLKRLLFPKHTFW